MTLRNHREFGSRSRRAAALTGRGFAVNILVADFGYVARIPPTIRVSPVRTLITTEELAVTVTICPIVVRKGQLRLHINCDF